METVRMSLVEGTYTPAHAQEMLSKLIKNELQFQRFQNFTSLIRYEGNCEQATENIYNLSRAQEELDRLVARAKAENLCLRLETNLRLSLVEQAVLEQEQVACPSL